MLDDRASLSVRLATAADAAAIADLVNAAFQVEATFKIGDRTDVDDIRDHLERGQFLVAVDPAGAMLACVYLESEGARGYFGMLSVAPSLQRSGMGRRLIAEVEDRCRARGCSVMEIQIVDRRTELPPYYRRLGYVESGTTPFESADKLKLPCHFVRMTKPL